MAKLQDVQELRAYNSAQDRFEPMFLYYDQPYRITLEDGNKIVGWVNTKEEALVSVHKMAGFGTTNQLIILDYSLDATSEKSVLREENRVLDIQREVKYIEPVTVTAIRMVDPASKDDVIDADIYAGNKVALHKDLPIFIETVDKKKYRGFIHKVGKRGLLGRKEYIELKELRDIHPTNRIITIDFSRIRAAYPIRIVVR